MQPFHDLPRAPRTWAVFAPILAADEESAPVTFDTNRAIVLVGAYPTVARTAVGGTMPTLDDLLLRVELGSGLGLSAQRGRGIDEASSFCDARAFDTGERRSLDLLVVQDELVVTARWKVPALAAVSFPNCVVGLNFWGYYPTPTEVSELTEKLGGVR